MAMTADSLDKINFISNTMARFNLITLHFSFKHFLLQMPIVFNPPYYLNLQSKVNMLIHSVHFMKDFFVKHFLVRNLQITTFQVSTACWFFEVDP